MSEDSYRSVVDNSPYGIYRVTPDGSFVTVNPALCAMVGYSAEELFASNVIVLYPDAADRQRWLDDYPQRPPGAPVELQWKRKDDSADHHSRLGLRPARRLRTRSNTSTVTSRTSRPCAQPNRRSANPSVWPRSASWSRAWRTN